VVPVAFAVDSCVDTSDLKLKQLEIDLKNFQRTQIKMPDLRFMSSSIVMPEIVPLAIDADIRKPCSHTQGMQPRSFPVVELIATVLRSVRKNTGDSVHSSFAKLEGGSRCKLGVTGVRHNIIPYRYDASCGRID
jgi:hypothetical protein